MHVIAAFANLTVSKRIEILSSLANVKSLRHDVEEMRDDARGEEAGPVFIVVIAPGIAGALGENFKLLRDRVIAPDAGVHRHAFVVRRARLADQRMREHALAAVQPAVRAPDEAIDGLVRILIAEAVEQHGALVGLVVALRRFEEEKIGRLTDKY